jgi:hypothetical protein
MHFERCSKTIVWDGRAALLAPDIFSESEVGSEFFGPLA